MISWGGRSFLATSNTVVQMSTGPVQTSPLAVYHLLCDISFVDMTTGLASCPDCISVWVPLSSAVSLELVPWVSTTTNLTNLTWIIRFSTFLNQKVSIKLYSETSTLLWHPRWQVHCLWVSYISANRQHTSWCSSHCIWLYDLCRTHPKLGQLPVLHYYTLPLPKTEWHAAEWQSMQLWATPNSGNKWRSNYIVNSTNAVCWQYEASSTWSRCQRFLKYMHTQT